ncbi:MAG: penicillin-binding protein 2, partial [Cellulomonadaceae bacterium]|nr:penicillin-binding protein 2 [Cellulomonadaceae bacterium]
PNKQEFHDSTNHDTWNLTAAGVLGKSSNTGMIQISEAIPSSTLYDYFKKFQLGEFSGLGLPGESRGKVHEVAKWDGRTKYAVAFGQGLTVNAIQAVGVYATVANGGVYSPPSLIRGIREASATEVVAPENKEQIKVIEPETAETLLKMMELATSDEGTARTAQIPGYRIAGKSGTAELKHDGKTTYFSSYIGVVSADDPKFTVAVFIRNPKGQIFGGVVAAPVFREVASFLIQNREMAPSTPDPKPLAMWWE